MSARGQYANWYQLEVVTDTMDRYGRECVLQSNITTSYTSPYPIKVADLPLKTPTRTLFRQAKDSEAAKRWAEKIGKVISCIRVKAEEMYEVKERQDQRLITENPLNIQLTSESVSIDASLRVSLKRNRMNVQIR